MFEHDLELPEGLSPRLEAAIRQIGFARRYTLSLLEDLSEDEWYWVPGDSESPVTHIAWQCGHIAMAEYGLTLFRQRGRASVDSELMSGKFRKRFMRGTTPTADRASCPSPTEIREVMDRVHGQLLKEAASFDGPSLDEPEEPPHAGFATRYGSLLFAAHHEMLHAGQIGLLRRLMGKPPLR